MNAKEIISLQVQKEVSDKLINMLSTSISMGITYLEKSLLATARSKIGYEICLSDDDKSQMFTILERLDPKQYNKYCISTREEYNDLMAQPLRNNVTYITSFKGLYTWILVSTRSWDKNIVDHTFSDELNLFVFGMYADIIKDMIIDKFNPARLEVRISDDRKEDLPLIKTYVLGASKDQNDGCLNYSGAKQVKRLNQIFTNSHNVENLIDYIAKWNQASTFFHSKGITHKLGIMLYGPPGTGKTTLAQSIAAYFKMPLVTLSPGDFCKATVSRIQNHRFDDTFILLIEDIDYIFGRGKDEQTTEENERFNQLLQFLDGVHSVPNMIIIATTNDYDSLDEALKRKGRFDHKIEMNNIDKENALKMVAELNITKVPLSLDDEEFPINPVHLQTKIVEHVFANIDSVNDEVEPDETIDKDELKHIDFIATMKGC